MKNNLETSIVRILKKSGLLIAFICFIAFTIIFFTTKARLDKEHDEKIQSTAEIITQAVQIADRSTGNLEHLVDLRLYSISKAIGTELQGMKASEVSRERLEQLRMKWGLSGISLFVETSNDIVVAQSTDAKEVGVGSKKWGYWYEAFKQLFRGSTVNVGKGHSEPDFWASPVSLSEVEQKHYKYVYYYDGQTDFILNPFISADEMYQLAYDAGPSQLIQKIVSYTGDIDSIAVINVSAYIKERPGKVIEPEFDLPVLYGYDKYPIDSDKPLFRKALRENIHETVKFKRNGETLGEVTLPGSVSSQFISGLLLAAPYAKQALRIRIDGPVVQRDYVEMTIDMMKSFGVEPAVSGDGQTIDVSPGVYKARSIALEPDLSTCSYFWALAALTKGRIRINGIDVKTRQPDIEVLDVLKRMGCTVMKGEYYAEVAGTGRLRGGFTLSMKRWSDQTLTIAALAVYADGPITLTDAAHIRHHECDRIAAICGELRKLGIQTDERPDGLTVYPGEPRPALLDPHDDHRMAMALSLIGARTAGIRIADPGCVSKTCPDYFDRLRALGAAVTFEA